MSVVAGNYGAILTNGVGQAPPAAPDSVEVLTEGWFAGFDDYAAITLIYPGDGMSVPNQPIVFAWTE